MKNIKIYFVIVSVLLLAILIALLSFLLVKPCGICDGDGVVRCGACGLNGHLECERCNADGALDCLRCYRGQIDCDDCNGRGYTKGDECSDCNGDGRVLTSIDLSDLPDVLKRTYRNVRRETGGFWSYDCTDCDGSGIEHIDCRTCNESGELRCPDCNGSGSEGSCPDCNGTGMITCKTCDGKKTITCDTCQGTAKQFIWE